MNVSLITSIVVKSGLATLHDLQTVYGLEDLWDMLEIHSVAQYNERQAAKRAAKS